MKKKLTQRGRVALAGVIGATAVATVAVTAGVGFARDSVGAAQYQYGNKVTICHHTHAKHHPFVTIRVGPRAVKAHLRHGDTMGACASATTKSKGKGHKSAPQQPAQPAATTPASPSHGNGNGHGKPADPGSNGNGHGKGKTK